MNELKQSTGYITAQTTAGSVDYLALYNRFGAMAYGMILQIVPQETVAQQVLVDVFSSPELKHCYAQTGSGLACVIKVTRQKALMAKKVQEETLAEAVETSMDTDTVTPELLFNLSYKQGLSPDTIAQQYGLTKADVLKAIREYVKSFRKL
ncbi:hypothetical protein [Arsenicibacter rosenii]|uniref:Uncharacterized protein n=1 Tax=Arsenicibacter rosenii TaxID=1750698 RepID=A0A1S2VF66_9BACT|nr:hypothetical protein [Arsenicibacter rosenii]OIN56846.1 hypothetical protein BLX24_23020 [Arsenicibacter rosenii]